MKITRPTTVRKRIIINAENASRLNRPMYVPCMLSSASAIAATAAARMIAISAMIADHFPSFVMK